jgi:hypothetical protein
MGFKKENLRSKVRAKKLDFFGEAPIGMAFGRLKLCALQCRGAAAPTFQRQISKWTSDGQFLVILHKHCFKLWILIFSVMKFWGFCIFLCKIPAGAATKMLALENCCSFIYFGSATHGLVNLFIFCRGFSYLHEFWIHCFNFSRRLMEKWGESWRSSTFPSITWSKYIIYFQIWQNYFYFLVGLCMCELLCSFAKMPVLYVWATVSFPISYATGFLMFRTESVGCYKTFFLILFCP